MNFYINLLLTDLESRFKGRTAMLPEVIETIKAATGSDCWSNEFYLRIYDAYLNQVSDPQPPLANGQEIPSRASGFDNAPGTEGKYPPFLQTSELT